MCPSHKFLGPLPGLCWSMTYIDPVRRPRRKLPARGRGTSFTCSYPDRQSGITERLTSAVHSRRNLSSSAARCSPMHEPLLVRMPSQRQSAWAGGESSVSSSRMVMIDFDIVPNRVWPFLWPLWVRLVRFMRFMRRLEV